MKTITIAAVDQAYADGVRKLFDVLRSEVTTHHDPEESVKTFGRGLKNLDLVRQLALKSIEDFEETRK